MASERVAVSLTKLRGLRREGRGKGEYKKSTRRGEGRPRREEREGRREERGERRE
jgi:hypothetical protein